MRGRAGEIDQIAFEIVRSGLRALFLFGHATSDRLFLSFFSERIRQAGASPVLSNAESETDASSSEDDSESSPSSEVSVSEEESEVEFSPEAAEVISIPPFRMESREREHQILLKAEYLLSRGEVDDEYVHDIHRNLKETADLGEWAYRPHLDFEEFEVGMLEKRLEVKDHLFSLFSRDHDPEVVQYKEKKNRQQAKQVVWMITLKISIRKSLRTLKPGIATTRTFGKGPWTTWAFFLMISKQMATLLSLISNLEEQLSIRLKKNKSFALTKLTYLLVTAGF